MFVMSNKMRNDAAVDVAGVKHRFLIEQKISVGQKEENMIGVSLRLT